MHPTDIDSVVPPVTLTVIKDAIAAKYYMTADQALGPKIPVIESLKYTTICILVMRNGYAVLGTSPPARKEEFDPIKGRNLAFEDALRQLWPLMEFARCDWIGGEKSRVASEESRAQCILSPRQS